MTNLQRLQIEQSEKRERINELLGKETLTDEERAELGNLTKRMQELETETRAAIVAEDDAESRARLMHGDDAEARELRELRGRVSVGNYLAAAQDSQSLEGAEQEYNQAVKVRAGRFPLHLLAPEPEVRAETDASAQANQQSWIDRVFEQSMATRLGITMRSVAPGVATYPVTTAGASGGQRARMEAKSADTQAISAIELKPKRNVAHLVFSQEDDMRIPGLEDALRRDMRMAVAEAVDRACFVGDSGADGTDADITGLQTATGVTEKTLTQSNKLVAGQVHTKFVELVDGKYASMLDDLNIVASVGSNTLWETTVLSVSSETASVFKTLASFLRENGIMWATRGGINTATTNNTFGAFVGLKRGIEGAATAAIWDEAQLIRDPYSAANKGEVNLTLAYFWDFAIPRAANFARLKYVS